MEIGANQAAHFNSTDLERGNPGKALTGSTTHNDAPYVIRRLPRHCS